MYRTLQMIKYVSVTRTEQVGEAVRSSRGGEPLSTLPRNCNSSFDDACIRVPLNFSGIPDFRWHVGVGRIYSCYRTAPSNRFNFVDARVRTAGYKLETQQLQHCIFLRDFILCTLIYLLVDWLETLLLND